MDKKMIRIEDFNTNVFEVLDRGWMLLTGGCYDSGSFNTMTISWGMMGTFWGRPVVTVGVRPGRYTYQFMEEFDTFTLCAFPAEFRPALALCGAKSGRDTDKIAESHLTPIRGEYVEAPAFAEADLIIECRKLYTHQLAPKNIMDKSIVSGIYPERDFHKLYVGQVMGINATNRYRRERD